MVLILKAKQTRRIQRYVIVFAIIGLVYYFWPVQQIEHLSNNLSIKEKNDYIDSILNPTKDEPIYNRASGPLKADFNPNSQYLDVPEVINVDNVNKALNKINMKPLYADDEVSSAEKVNILSEVVTKREFTPIQSLSGFIGNLDVDNKVNYYEDLTCGDVSYNPSSKERILEYAEPILLDDDMLSIRKYLLNSRYADVIKTVDPTAGESDVVSDINHWYRKSGSSVWLPDEQLHLVVSSILYAPNDKNSPLASFIRLQLFDSEWKEVIGRRIRFSGLDEKDIDGTLRAYSKTKDEKYLDQISLRFPSILNVPFEVKAGKGTVGPVDPKIIYKDGEHRSEPVIIFNMLTSGNKRSMFAVFPFQSPKGPKLEHPVLRFKNIGNDAVTRLRDEKNWIPFFDGVKIGDTRNSNGNMYFAYTLDPLVIFKCSLDTGKCTKVQDNVKFSKFAKNDEGFLRGGTSFTPVPRQIIQSLTDGDYQKRLQMWVSFPKFFLKTNSCGQNMYRPTFSLLIKEDGVFRIELITSPIDFGLPSAKDCPLDEPSIITANSIAFWDIASTGVQESNGSIPYYNDYMGLFVGDATSKIELIVMKNVLNYAMGVYSHGRYMLGEYDLEGGVSDRTRKVCECVLDSALQYEAKLGGIKRLPVDKTIEH